MLVREMMADPLLKKYRYAIATKALYWWFSQDAVPVSPHEQTKAAKWNLATIIIYTCAFPALTKCLQTAIRHVALFLLSRLCWIHSNVFIISVC